MLELAETVYQGYALGLWQNEYAMKVSSCDISLGE
jgi:hypothetical protein